MRPGENVTYASGHSLGGVYQGYRRKLLNPWLISGNLPGCFRAEFQQTVQDAAAWRRVPGVSSQAPQPLANFWQPFRLLQLAKVRGSVSLAYLNKAQAGGFVRPSGT